MRGIKKRGKRNNEIKKPRQQGKVDERLMLVNFIPGKESRTRDKISNLGSF